MSFVLAAECQLPEQLVVTGDLRADASIELCSETEGRVVRAGLERGQGFEVDAVVVELDDRDAKSRLAEAEAQLAQIEARLGPALQGQFDPELSPDVRLAQVNMARAGREASRYERLVADGAVSRSLHDVERANYDVAREKYAAEVDRVREQFRALQAQQARVTMARKAVEDTRVRAPWTGAVLERHVDVGQYVRKGDRLASLVKTDVIRAELAVPEPQAAAVQPGQQVQFDVRSRPGKTFVGRVAFVGPGLDAASRALAVEVVLDNSAGELRPGSFAAARIELAATRPVVVVAQEAIASNDGTNHVFVVSNGCLERRLVQVGRRVGAMVEVVRGLAAGEKVAVQGVARLVDGAVVLASMARE
ncbi:MAG: efflux RND transporter periplasmic adaptor subunit [Planctomycetota bacterium]